MIIIIIMTIMMTMMTIVECTCLPQGAIVSLFIWPLPNMKAKMPALKNKLKLPGLKRHGWITAWWSPPLARQSAFPVEFSWSRYFCPHHSVFADFYHIIFFENYLDLVFAENSWFFDELLRVPQFLGQCRGNQLWTCWQWDKNRSTC